MARTRQLKSRHSSRIHSAPQSSMVIPSNNNSRSSHSHNSRSSHRNVVVVQEEDDSCLTVDEEAVEHIRERLQAAAEITEGTVGEGSLRASCGHAYLSVRDNAWHVKHNPGGGAAENEIATLHYLESQQHQHSTSTRTTKRKTTSRTSGRSRARARSRPCPPIELVQSLFMAEELRVGLMPTRKAMEGTPEAEERSSRRIRRQRNLYWRGRLNEHVDVSGLLATVPASRDGRPLLNRILGNEIWDANEYKGWVIRNNKKNDSNDTGIIKTATIARNFIDTGAKNTETAMEQETDADMEQKVDADESRVESENIYQPLEANVITELGRSSSLSSSSSSTLTKSLFGIVEAGKKFLGFPGSNTKPPTKNAATDEDVVAAVECPASKKRKLNTDSEMDVLFVTEANLEPQPAELVPQLQQLRPQQQPQLADAQKTSTNDEMGVGSPARQTRAPALDYTSTSGHTTTATTDEEDHKEDEQQPQKASEVSVAAAAAVVTQKDEPPPLKASEVSEIAAQKDEPPPLKALAVSVVTAQKDEPPPPKASAVSEVATQKDEQPQRRSKRARPVQKQMEDVAIENVAQAVEKVSLTLKPAPPARSSARTRGKISTVSPALQEETAPSTNDQDKPERVSARLRHRKEIAAAAGGETAFVEGCMASRTYSVHIKLEGMRSLGVLEAVMSNQGIPNPKKRRRAELEESSVVEAEAEIDEDTDGSSFVLSTSNILSSFAVANEYSEVCCKRHDACFPLKPFVNDVGATEAVHSLMDEMEELDIKSPLVEEDDEDFAVEQQVRNRTARIMQGRRSMEKNSRDKEKELSERIKHKLLQKEWTNKKKAAPSVEELEWQDIGNRALVFEGANSRRAKTITGREMCPCAIMAATRGQDDQPPPCRLCYNPAEFEIAGPIPIKNMMPSVRKIDVDAPEFLERDTVEIGPDDSNKEGVATTKPNPTTTRGGRRMKFDPKKRRETVGKLVEVNASIEFVEQYNAGLLPEVTKK